MKECDWCYDEYGPKEFSKSASDTDFNERVRDQLPILSLFKSELSNIYHTARLMREDGKTSMLITLFL